MTDTGADGRRPRTVGEFFKDRSKQRRPRKPSNRNWPGYNLSQENLKRHFYPVLSHLAYLVGQPVQTMGRPITPMAEILVAAVLKGYFQTSARVLTSDLAFLQKEGLIRDPPRWSTILKYMGDPDMTEFFKTFVTVSALPCRQVETTFAFDATGLTVHKYVSYSDKKYGRTKGGTRKWVKLSVAVGRKTRVVVSADARVAETHDTKIFPGLLETASQYFTIREILADSGYLSRFNLGLADRLDAIPLIPFKSSTVIPLIFTDSAWDKSLRYYLFKRDEFGERYVGRNVVEGAFSAHKRVSQPDLLGRTDPGLVNETYCRLIGYNIARLIHTFYEFQDAIDPTDFGIYDPIYPTDRGKPPIVPSDDTPDPDANCSCPVHLRESDQFWTFPGQKPSPRDHTSRVWTPRTGTAPSGASGAYADNILYLPDFM